MSRSSLESSDEALVERATNFVCRRCHVAQCDRDDVRQDIFVKLLGARRRFEGRGGAPFGGYAWRGLLGAAIDGLHRRDGISASEWKRGKRRPRQFGEGEEHNIARVDSIPAFFETREVFDQLLAPLRKLGGILESIHTAIRINRRTIREVAESLDLNRGVVRRLRDRADLIVRCVAKRQALSTTSTRQLIPDTEVQMDKFAQLEVSLSQLRAEAHLIACEFSGVFDGVALRKHFESQRAVFEAGDPVAASKICKCAYRLIRLHSELIKLDIRLLAERNTARAHQRQLKLFLD